ncbi:hypothetical protein FH972_018317 [Carpinus fangiana]|uniref:Alginate lyase 2 domain-containing protein n=1 Tax=Carpinus fangiana TaxID=176857 RepID=A0A5N6RPM9_9ROSI|nr:hypothetical protein FH972_018317 [Carpinus fangiana]
MNSSFCYSVLLVLFLVSSFEPQPLCGADPTDGFTPVPLTDNNLQLQRPYNVPLQDRYSNKDGVRTLWVYSNDKPFKADSPTRPRTEIRIAGHDYSSGVWQFEGNAFVPKGTTGVAIAQILGAAEGATTMQLRMYNGDLKYYNSELVASNMYDKWFRVNIIHDVNGGKVTVFIDGVQKYVGKDKGKATMYFKCGVYTQDGSSNYMESRWKGIKLFKK